MSDSDLSVKSYEELAMSFEQMNLFKRIKKENTRAEIVEIVQVIRVEAKNRRKKDKQRRQTQLWKNFKSSFSEISVIEVDNRVQAMFNEHNDLLFKQKDRIINIEVKLDRTNVIMNRMLNMQKNMQRTMQRQTKDYILDRHHRKLRRNSQGFNHSIDSQSFKNNQSLFVNRSDQSLFASKSSSSLFTSKSMNFAIDISKKERFKTSDVGYFDFHLNDRYDEEDVIINDEKIIYRDVHLWIEAIKFIAILMKY